MFSVSKSAAPVAGGELAGALDFDGTNDYLSRSSDLVGNADGKTFTFSAWVWDNGDQASNDHIYTSYVGASTEGFAVFISGGAIRVQAKDTAGTTVLNAECTVDLPKNTLVNATISIDLANTSNRGIYVNDVAQTVTWTTYTNSAINFTNTIHYVGSFLGTPTLFGRLAHLYLDYTYRDLSIEANRRLFITADRKPSPNQEALNPILYLPMTDPTQPGKNLGTGGDFALTGVVARSGRGPNQFNAPYSDLDGAADYLSRTTAPTGIADGKQLTFAATVAPKSLAANVQLFVIGKTGANPPLVAQIASDGKLYFAAKNAAGTTLLDANYNLGAVVGRNYQISASFDLSDSAKRKVVVNGIDVSSSVTWAIYENDTVDFTSNFYFVGAYRNTTSTLIGSNAKYGNVFFDTRYIDLSVPENLAKFVTGTGIDAKPVDLGANGELPFGTPPLIYLPMYGNNAGKNYGTGGDFTVNSGPFPGARGPNEYWGNKAAFGDGIGNYLSRAFNIDTSSGSWVFSSSSSYASSAFSIGALGDKVTITRFASGNIEVVIKTGADVTVLQKMFSGVLTNSVWYTFFLSFNLATPSAQLYIVNSTGSIVLANSAWTTLVAGSARINTGYVGRSNVVAPGTGSSQSVSEFYFATDYIDFSQEANRLKFRDAFGNPVALLPQIEAGEIPNPAIYMRFDPANFGKNSGTGGDFTVNGTITDAGQL